jgi:hypothetical protein
VVLGCGTVLGDQGQIATSLGGDLLLARVVAAQQLAGVDTGLDAPRELDLLGCAQQRRAADLVEVDAHQVSGRGDLVKIARRDNVFVARGDTVFVARRGGILAGGSVVVAGGNGVVECVIGHIDHALGLEGRVAGRHGCYPLSGQ